MKELSEKNSFKIDKFRYLELKNFCRQYGTWNEAYKSLTTLSQRSPEDIPMRRGFVGNPVEEVTNAAMSFKRRMDVIDDTIALLPSPVVKEALKLGVTEGLSYDQINARLNLSYCREYYYKYYRMFFCALSTRRDLGRF